MIYYLKKVDTENKLTFKIIWSNHGMDDKIIPIANVKIPTRITASRPVTKNIWLFYNTRKSIIFMSENIIISVVVVVLTALK